MKGHEHISDVHGQMKGEFDRKCMPATIISMYIIACIAQIW